MLPEGEVGGERALSILSCSLTRSYTTVEVVNISADTLAIDQLVFWYLFFLCNLMYVMGKFPYGRSRPKFSIAANKISLFTHKYLPPGRKGVILLIQNRIMN